MRVATRRRKAAERNPLFADVRALQDAKRTLTAHRESIADAKRARDAGIEGGRDSLREYKRPLSTSIIGRRAELERSMMAVDHFDESLQAAKRASRRRVHRGRIGSEDNRPERLPRPPRVEAVAKHLLELKARYEDLGKARALLSGAKRLGVFAQVDTYFSLGERRLKLRSVEGMKEGQLVYYERPDLSGVKESRVLLASLPDAASVRDILTRILPVKAEVRKTREMYRFRGVQVHLDTVAGLGRFLEFEKIVADESEREEGREQLESLCRYFQIPDEDRMASSYSDFFESK